MPFLKPCAHPECLQSEDMPQDIITSYTQDNDVFITNSSYSSGSTSKSRPAPLST